MSKSFKEHHEADDFKRHNRRVSRRWAANNKRSFLLEALR